MAYDPNNRFAKILRGEIKLPDNEIVYRDQYALAFVYDKPQHPVHVLVIPTGPYENMLDFNARASAEERLGFWDAVSEVTRRLNIAKPGFRLHINTGKDAEQHMPHFHVHIVGGAPLGPLWPNKASAAALSPS